MSLTTVEKGNPMNGKIVVGWVLFALVVLLLLNLVMSSFAIVDAGFVGVKRTFGSVHKQPLPPGLNWKKPWIDDVIMMETRLKSFEVDATAASRDLQIVKTKISVQHSLNGELAPESYAAIGDLDKFDVSVVSPAVMESLKAVTAKYTAEELITKREIVKQESSDAIQKFINHTLEEKGIPGALHIANVAIKDFDFSHEFNASIEAKVRAQQEALTAKNEKEKRITNAEAAARERELAADAEAYQVEKISLQRAAAIKREAEALAQNPLILQMRAIEKWNGTVPQVNGSQQMIPFIQIETKK